MKKVLNIVRSAPGELEKKFIDAFAEAEENKVIALYKGDVDWSDLVDEIFAYDQVVCWW
ncbi:MAG: hypothetical protein KKH68_03250 [Proteobacteria bacterium]|nr:hypothetical protein [Pseudomonadota bacterium]